MDTVVMLALSDKAGETLAEGAGVLMLSLGIAAILWILNKH